MKREELLDRFASVTPCVRADFGRVESQDA